MTRQDPRSPTSVNAITDVGERGERGLRRIQAIFAPAQGLRDAPLLLDGGAAVELGMGRPAAPSVVGVRSAEGLPRLPRMCKVRCKASR